MTHTSNKLKAASFAFSGLLATSCLVMPLTALADTTSSVDEIMEQMKSFKAPTPKVISEPVKVEIKEIEVKKAEEPVTIEEKPAEKSNSSIYVAPPEIERERKTAKASAPKQARAQPKATKKKRKAKKRKTRRQSSPQKQVINQGGAVDYKGFDERYMSLINDILNDKVPSSSNKSIKTRPVQARQGKNFAGTSGWIYLGKHSRGRWLASKSLKSGSALPVAGQQYTVKTPLLNMRKNRPTKSGLGKLMQVLHVGDKLDVIRVHRSSNNNYWANVVRP